MEMRRLPRPRDGVAVSPREAKVSTVGRWNRALVGWFRVLRGGRRGAMIRRKGNRDKERDTR